MLNVFDGKRQVHSEALGYWFLRLNGFLTIPNFVVHPDEGSNQGTDVDVMGVRFPYRSENRKRPMVDSHYFTDIRGKTYVALAEIKKTTCFLNGVWTAPERQNMQRVLSALGMVEFPDIEAAAQGIYEHGYFENQCYYISMVCFGDAISDHIQSHYPKVPQILWPEVKQFVWQRFRRYRTQKVSHPQWDEVGKYLWDFATSRDPATDRHITADRFVELLIVTDQRLS